MLAAGHKAKAEFSLIKGDIGEDQRQNRDDHKPVELKAANVHQKRLLLADVLDGGGHVIGIFGGVDGLYDDRGCRHTQQVHGGADDGLIRFEIDTGHSQQTGEQHAHKDGADQRGEDHGHGGGACGHVFHDQRAAQGAHDHDAFKADVDHAGMFGEAAAQSNEQQHRGKNQCVLDKKQHYF